MSAEKELFPVICCSGETVNQSMPDLTQFEPPPGGLPWQTGSIKTPDGEVFQVATTLSCHDKIGSWKARWGVGRMDYRIPPGLYTAGSPSESSPVLVSANYKMSFDALRRELGGLDLWILVIDTRGINVWCAAGKGTFGTDEIVAKIKATQLERVVSHRRIILPQLAAPGVAAHEVSKRSGFKVVYGPIRAADLPAFLQAGNKASPEMRAVRFNFIDRIVLSPVELTALLKPALGLIIFLFLLNTVELLLNQSPLSEGNLLRVTLVGLIPFLGAALSGAALVPALLPYIPGRAFAWKGWLLGTLWTLTYLAFIAPKTGWLEAASYFLLLPAIAAFLSMNFTGSSTYTSLSGVLKEMGVALPSILVSAGLGVCAFIAGRFI